MKITFFVFLSFVLFSACSSLKLSKEEKEMKLFQVSQNIENNNFAIKINRANPMRGKSIHLTSPYDLTIRNDSAIAHLPFFGRATFAPYGNKNGGIMFAEKMERYQVTPTPKNDGWNVSFNVSQEIGYSYYFNIIIYREGNSSINVSSPQRDSITFWGEMKLDSSSKDN